jgi:ribosomal protein L3 glutamine methyltransferase
LFNHNSVDGQLPKANEDKHPLAALRRNDYRTRMHHELFTIRDFLRHAVSRFRAAKLEHAHGARDALDEAAFMILETLHLPVDDINPWLDCRLLPDERQRISGLIDARIQTRKPFAYLLKKTYLQSVPFFVDERVIVPRSYLAELMFDDTIISDDGFLITEPEAISSVLDLCTGSGCLAILAAMRFPEAHIDAVDLSPKALEVAKINCLDHQMDNQITLFEGDLFAPLGKRKYDLIITNPPYVSQRLVDAFPPEHKAEPVMAHLGGEDGLDIVRRILAVAPEHLSDDGLIICEIGEDRDILEAEYDLPFTWLDTETSEGEVFALRRDQF